LYLTVPPKGFDFSGEFLKNGKRGRPVEKIFLTIDCFIEGIGIALGYTERWFYNRTKRQSEWLRGLLAKGFTGAQIPGTLLQFLVFWFFGFLVSAFT
jgi:hypothetical protein